MRCIHCSALQPVELNNIPYKQYRTTGTIKLLNCSYCHQLIDKYIEYQFIIVLIELLLFRSIAYRHILYNTYSKLVQFITLFGVFIIYTIIIYTVIYNYISI